MTGTFSDEMPAIAYTGTCWHMLVMNNVGLQCHCRHKILPGIGAARRHHAIENQTRPDHIQMHLRESHSRCAITDMLKRDRQTDPVHLSADAHKLLELLLCICNVVFVGCGKMRK